MTTDTLAKLAHEIWSAAQLAPGEGIEDGIARIEALLRDRLVVSNKTMPLIARQRGEWHEDDGDAVWWAWNGETRGWAGEPAYIGSPLSSDWPGYHTHWTPHPEQPKTTTGGGVTTGAPSEPFGYFKAQPFGWTDCAEDDDGAVALYEGPQQAAQALTEALALSDDALSHAINQAACDIATDRAPDDRIRAIGRALWRQWQAQQAAQASNGKCDECGKDQADGWALYCVGCLEKTGLLAKEALPSAQHVSSTAADLTGPNDTAAQAPTLTDHEIEALAHLMCWRYKKSSDPHHSDTYTFNLVTLLDFVRKTMQGEIK